MSRSIALASVLPLLATVASAQNAASLHYQGFLSDQGVPVEDTSAQVAFRLYDVQTGGSPYAMGLVLPIEQDAATTGAALGVGNTATGPDGIAIEATTDATSATAVLGRALAPGGETIGVTGITDSPSGRGIVGLASSMQIGTGNLPTAGVYGEAAASRAVGVFGTSPSTGVRGVTTSNGGVGVEGAAEVTGVLGRA